MKAVTTLFALSFLSITASAADLCTKYENKPRYMKAIETVAKYQQYTMEEFCSHPRVLDIEVQPSQVINNKGEVIPHMSVQQHFSYDSCLYMVNETDYSITRARCYSGE